LSEVKLHLHIDDDNTTFDDDLTRLIKQAREYCEEQTGLSLIERTVTFYVDYYSPFTIPFGPVTSFDSASIKTGINEYEVQTVDDEYEVEAGIFYSYIGNWKWKLIYDAGYTSATIPQGLKLAILNEIAFRFENRGDVVLLNTNELLQPYKLIEWLM
jgi:hypothetical protein